MKKSDFLILKKELIETANQLGSVVRISRTPFRRNRFGVRGSYSIESKRINIEISGKCSYSLILAVLAHEVRHAQHHNLGLFPGFYDLAIRSKAYRESIRQGLVIPPSIDEGQAAEDDCNLFAINWLKRHGINLNKDKSSYCSFFEPYDKYDLATYRLWLLVPKEILKSNKDLPCPF